MPNKDPNIAKKRKHEWYVKNKELILQRKREWRAALKKAKPPKPPKPPPTPEEKARTRELNRLACHQYWASHLPQVRLTNQDYYRRHQERITQQQRDRRARAKLSKPFRKLRALADVCSQRLIELDHG